MTADGVPVRTKECRHGRLSYLAHDLYVGRSLDLYGEFSEHEVQLFRQIVGDGAVVLEAGANIGALTVPIARAAGARGRVIAYEPQPALAALLRHNMTANALTWVEVRQAALGRAAGTLRVPRIDYHQPFNFGGVSLHDGDGEPVPVETIDALNLTRLDLLKIDVEGMEGEVLAGAVATIRRLQPLIHVENDREHSSPALLTALEDLGYSAWWHFSPLFNPANFFGNTENAFPRILSVNMLCAPTVRGLTVTGSTPVLGRNDTWIAARDRIRAGNTS